MNKTRSRKRLIISLLTSALILVVSAGSSLFVDTGIPVNTTPTIEVTGTPTAPRTTVAQADTSTPTLSATATETLTPESTYAVNLPQIADGADLLPNLPTPSSTAMATPTPTLSESDLIIQAATKQSFVYAVDQNLYVDGQPYIFIGVNATYLTETYFPENQIEPILTYLAETGGVNAIRLFFKPGHDLDRLEKVLDIGGELGIRFIVTLQDYYYYKSQMWFAEEYLTEDIPHVIETVSRFKDRPEILAWELMNEPGCGPENGSQDCADFMYAWAQDVSSLIKELDPNHLISVGTNHRMWTEAEQTNYDRMHALDTIDIVSIHRDATDENKTAEMELAAELNKPVFIGEIYYLGYNENCHKLYDGVFEERAAAIQEDLERSLANGVDGYLLWQYDPYEVLMDDGTIQWFCGQYSYFQYDPVFAVLAQFLNPGS